MKRVLIITYYWPPSGGSSVLRWLKFTRYLPEFGWEPVIYTPENPESQEIDEALLKEIPENTEILKTKIREPYSIYKLITGRRKEERIGVSLMSDKKTPGFIQRLSLWIRSNLFVPDPKCWWIKPSVKTLIKYLADHPVDIIITTGPPHSMHLIGLGLKRKTGIRWLADFRDPWTNIDFYSELLLTVYADKKHRKLEKEVLENADCVVTVSETWAEELCDLGSENVVTIHNGFDYPSNKNIHVKSEGRFAIMHLGSIPKSRNPEIFWQVLSELIAKDTDFKNDLRIQLTGKVDQSVTAAIQKAGLSEYLDHINFIPHEQTFQYLSSASVLLLLINNSPNSKGILTNKFYEYLSAQRPILAIGRTDGDAAKTLEECKAGFIMDYKESNRMKAQIEQYYTLYKKNQLHVNSKNYEIYSRKNLTKELSRLLTRLINTD